MCSTNTQLWLRYGSYYEESASVIIVTVLRNHTVALLKSRIGTKIYIKVGY